MTKVTIVQRRLTHYRVDFFERLKVSLAEHKIELVLVVGNATELERLKRDSGEIEWCTPTKIYYFYKDRLNWLSLPREASSSDLLVLTHENSQLSNVFRLMFNRSGLIALWGHGGNLQGEKGNFREKFKLWYMRRACWYFAYTDVSVQRVVNAGFPIEKTTCTNNSLKVSCKIKSQKINCNKDGFNSEADTCFKSRKYVGVFMGSLYSHKRLDFLISASKLIKLKENNFNLVIVGDGPERSLVEKASHDLEWVSYLGVLKGSSKFDVLGTADIFLNPGLVGLGILDAFSASLPVVTTDCGLHSPEIAYLDRDNGVMTTDSVECYADACVSLMHDKIKLKRLSEGALKSAQKYDLDSMVRNFTRGIIKCLSE